MTNEVGSNRALNANVKSIFILVFFSMLLVVSGCSYGVQGNVKAKDFNSWINSQILLEEFPYDTNNIYNIDKPSAKEEKGISIMPFPLNEASYKVEQIDKIANGTTSDVGSGGIFSVNVAMASITNINSSSKIDISKKAAPSDFKNVIVSGKMNMSLSSDLIKNMVVNSQSKTSFDAKFKNSEFIVENVSVDGKVAVSDSGAGSTGAVSSSKNSNFGMRDIDSDKIISLPISGMIITPNKTIKIGDQWEKQVYNEQLSNVLVSGKSSANSSMLYTITLYTYTLAGFGNVNTKRCAIINFQSESYTFMEMDGAKTKEELKKKAKTLSKLSAKSLKEFMTAQSDFKAIVSLTQQTVKSEGVMAYDYKNGIIIDSHSGSYTLAGSGVGVTSSGPIVDVKAGGGTISVMKGQSIFHLSE